MNNRQAPINPTSAFGVPLEIGINLLAGILFIRKVLNFVPMILGILTFNFSMISGNDEKIRALLKEGGFTDSAFFVMDAGLNVLVECILLMAVYLESQELTFVWLTVNLFEVFHYLFLGPEQPFPALIMAMVFFSYQHWIVWAYKEQLRSTQAHRSMINRINDFINNNSEADIPDENDLNQISIDHLLPKWISVPCFAVMFSKIYILFSTHVNRQPWD